MTVATPSDLSVDASKVNSRPELPDGFPSWARELADLYFSGSTCLFVLHGNVHDLLPSRDASGVAFCSLSEFVAQQLFGSWDVVLAYDLGRGVRPLAGNSPARLQEMVQYVSSQLGDPSKWPRDPDQLLPALDRIVQRNLLEENAARRKRIAFLFEHAQYLVPAGDLATLARGPASRLVQLLAWAQNPYIKRINMAFCLIAEKLSEVNDRLVQNPHVATLEVPLPDADSRRTFIDQVGGPAMQSSEMTPESLTQLSSGLNLVNLNVVLARSERDQNGWNQDRFRQMKKNMIERQCRGLVSFVEPKHTLDTVVGHVAAKQRLAQDAHWIATGRLDAAPMGYLVCGPVGTGKTFLAECYSGSIGIPCLALRNFRSKYVGETEGNLEQVLTVLRSLGPVVVVVDEADAALGNREAEGDSGTSGRVFSMIASQMGNTDYRGRIIWMLLTSRPDLLPIDIKRQGRAEVHIPLFYPQGADEVQHMFRAMAGKNKIPLAEDAVPDVLPDRNLSGADIESIMLSALRRIMSDGRAKVEQADLQAALDAFIPSAAGLEKEMQELVAVLECTDREFLPLDWRKQVDEPGGRSKLQERLVTLRRMIDRFS